MKLSIITLIAAATLSACTCLTANAEAHDRYFATLSGAITHDSKFEADPSLKLGGYFYKDFYGYVQSTWIEKDAFKYENMDYEFGIGWQQRIKRMVPFVELNYKQEGDFDTKNWKKNIGYDFGFKGVINEKISPLVLVDDLFNNTKSDAKAGIEYKLTKKLSVTADYTVFEHNTPKQGDIEVTYTF